MTSVPFVTEKETSPASPIRRFSDSVTNYSDRVSKYVRENKRVPYLYASCRVVEESKTPLHVLDADFRALPFGANEV